MNVYPLLTILWFLIIMIAISTSDAQAFFFEHVVRFSFNPHPTYLDLFILNDIELTNEFYLIQKAGHMITFAVMYFFLLQWIKKPRTTFVLVGIFAINSEILQLYFNRNGRLFDMAIDLVGILFAYYICKLFLYDFWGSRKQVLSEK